MSAFLIKMVGHRGVSDALKRAQQALTSTRYFSRNAPHQNLSFAMSNKLDDVL